MAENKTKATSTSVATFIAAIRDETRQTGADVATFAAMHIAGTRR